MRKVALTNPDKVFWPREGYTKGDVVRYYARVASVILPYLKNRPMVLNRHPNGIRGKSFFQKNTGTLDLPPLVETISIRARSTGRNVRYIICNNKATLLYLANLGCIEMHPWLSRTGKLNTPDCLVIDLDPGGNPYAQVIEIAKAVRKLVHSAGGRCRVKTSGKTGLHVYVPLRAVREFSEVRAVAKLIARIINARFPKLTSLSRNPDRRRHRIYLDYARNSIGQTLAAPYSLRAFPAATVATPVEWKELSRSFRPDRFTLRTIFRRLGTKGDIWKGQSRGAVNLRRLERHLAAIASEETARKRRSARAKA